MLHSAVVLNIQRQGTRLKSNAIKKKRKKRDKKDDSLKKKKVQLKLQSLSLALFRHLCLKTWN